MSFSAIKNILFDFICEDKMLQFFLWDFPSGRMRFAAHPFVLPFNFKNKKIHHLSEILPYLHPVDYAAINSCLEELPISPAHKVALKSFPIRVLDDQKNYYWLKIFLVIKKYSPTSCRIYGLIENIDADIKSHEKQKRILSALEHDALTKIYNKETFIRFTDKFLAQPENQNSLHAMLVIDADNFKDINDTLGHLYGDSVLQEIATKLQKHFRSDDFVARMGGDEYAVLMCHLNSSACLKDKIQALLKELKAVYHNQNHFVNFSMSIGIALYPQDGKNFQALFSHADLALYASKSAGKSRYSFYAPGANRHNVFYRSFPLKDLHDKRLQLFQKNMPEYIFRLFYRNKSIDYIIEHCLMMFGLLTNADRAVLFHYDKQAATFQLARLYTSERYVPIEPDVRAKYLPYAAHFVSKENSQYFRHGTVATCDDVDELPAKERDIFIHLKTRSFIQCLIHHGHTILGSIGIDNCTEKHHWTETEIGQLCTLATCFSFILLQKNASTQNQPEKSGVQNESFKK